MTTHIWFAYVPADGFASFGAKDLGTGAWGLIDITPWDGPGHTPLKPLGDAPVLVHFKLQLAWAVASVLAVREGTVSAKDRDKDWDNAQRALRGRLTAAAVSKDPAIREAAKRLETLLLSGSGGLAQTKLRYREEVDFGRKQVKAAATEQGAADVNTVGIQSEIAEVSATSEALAGATDHAGSNERPFEQIERVEAECATTFAAVAQQLAWMVEKAMPGEDKQRAMDLREPLERLSARYPAPEKAAKAATTADGKPATPPTAPAAPGGGGSGGTAAPGGGGSGGAPAPGGGGSGGAPAPGGGGSGGAPAPGGGGVG